MAGAAWRLFLAWPVRHWDSSLVSLAIGLMPYGLLAAVVSRSRSWFPYLGSVAILAVDVGSAVLAMDNSSSTGGVAILLAPLASTGLLVLLFALASVRRAA